MVVEESYPRLNKDMRPLELLLRFCGISKTCTSREVGNVKFV